jgi:FMN reductase
VSGPVVTAVIGNPRPESRTHRIARTLAGSLGVALGGSTGAEIDLAEFGPRVLDPRDEWVANAVDHALAADVLVVASPTYKATYSGLLKAFLDRIGTGALAGIAAVPVLLGGAPDHRLAVDVHFAPLLLELGATVPARGLFVLESDLDGFAGFAAAWAEQNRPAFGASRAAPSAAGFGS